MSAHLSESLDSVQAIRYAVTYSDALEPLLMETASERRLRKLKTLAEDPTRGGIRKIATVTK